MSAEPRTITYTNLEGDTVTARLWPVTDHPNFEAGRDAGTPAGYVRTTAAQDFAVGSEPGNSINAGDTLGLVPEQAWLDEESFVGGGFTLRVTSGECLIVNSCLDIGEITAPSVRLFNIRN